MSKIIDALKKNRILVYNIAGAFGVRGLSMLVSLFTMPAYIRFFNDRNILGIWYTLLSILNWVLYFDLGLGNGLRNKLPLCITKGDYKLAKEYISSTYFSTLIIVMIWSVIGVIIFPKLNWNEILNIKLELIDNSVLSRAVMIVFLGIMVQFILKLITSVLYALQRSAIVNLLTLITSITTLAIISILPTHAADDNLLRMAWVNVFAVNLPYLIATVIIFTTKLKMAFPQISFFTKKRVKEVLNIGLMLLWLQLVFMIISNTNEMLISHLTGAASVVEYQAYNKIFSTISSIFTLALTPIWSAVTKAASEKRYKWIQKLNRMLLIFSGLVLFCELIIIPFLQIAMDIWLGENYIYVNIEISMIFAAFNSTIFIHNVNTSICNGMSFFKVQLIWMTFAAIVDIPLAILLVNWLHGDWLGVIIANIIALIPFEVIEIIAFEKYIKNKLRETV